MSEPGIPARCGFVFAATGETYITLARRAARSLRLIHPDAEIDLFTEAPLDDPVFSEIHQLKDSWFRPKMEALARSRFERTVFLDADIMVVGPITTIFETLETFDLAACHDRYLNNAAGRLEQSRPVPESFAMLNSGVLGVRRTAATRDLLERWEAEVRESGAKRDQPTLRELVFHSPDLRLCVLPPGYNLLTFNELKSWWGMFGAPRVLHAAWLHRRRSGPGDPETPFTVEELVGRRNAVRIRALLHADAAITPDVPRVERRLNDPLEPGALRWLRRRVAPMYHKLRERRAR